MAIAALHFIDFSSISGNICINTSRNNGVLSEGYVICGGTLALLTKSCQKSFMKIIVFCVETLITLALAQIEDRQVGQNQSRWKGAITICGAG